MRTILGLLISALISLAIDLPNVPKVDTSNFSPGIKAQIEHAESEAKAHPRDAHMVANLGMILHAYHQVPVTSPFSMALKGLRPSNI